MLQVGQTMTSFHVFCIAIANGYAPVSMLWPCNSPFCFRTRIFLYILLKSKTKRVLSYEIIKINIPNKSLRASIVVLSIKLEQPSHCNRTVNYKLNTRCFKNKVSAGGIDFPSFSHLFMKKFGHCFVKVNEALWIKLSFIYLLEVTAWGAWHYCENSHIGTDTHFDIVPVTYCSRWGLTQITLDGDFADFYTFRKTDNELLWEHACRRPKRFRTSVERTGQNSHLQLSIYNRLERNLSHTQEKKKKPQSHFYLGYFKQTPVRQRGSSVEVLIP